MLLVTRGKSRSNNWDELERALATQAGGTVMLDASDGRYTVALSRLVYMKRYARESRVGFGI